MMHGIWVMINLNALEFFMMIELELHLFSSISVLWFIKPHLRRRRMDQSPIHNEFILFIEVPFAFTQL